MWMPADLGVQAFAHVLSFFMSYRPTAKTRVTLFRHGRYVADSAC
jgi:hypothetical protein